MITLYTSCNATNVAECLNGAVQMAGQNKWASGLRQLGGLPEMILKTDVPGRDAEIVKGARETEVGKGLAQVEVYEIAKDGELIAVSETVTQDVELW